MLSTLWRDNQSLRRLCLTRRALGPTEYASEEHLVVAITAITRNYWFPSLSIVSSPASPEGHGAGEAWTPLWLPGASCRGRRVACGGAALLTRAAAVEVSVVARAAIHRVVAITA